MSRIRIAHFSDVHFTLSPLAHIRESLDGKRVANVASYLLGGRRERFRDAPRRIEALLEDVDACGVDHALCTGDITAASLDAEFAGVAAIFGRRLAEPERYTVIPGNHDRYVARAVRGRAFERHFGALCPGADSDFPFEKRLAPGVRLVAFETARPTSLIDSSGLCGDAQRARLAEMLARDTGSLTLVAMHYGLLRYRGTPDHLRHGLRDHAEVIATLDASPARIGLVLHGHMHGAFTVRTATRSVICAGSATDLLVDCGYFIYDIDLVTHDVRIERRHWDRAANRYVHLPCEEFEDAVRTRRGAPLARQRPFV
jgi:3',5'-cyclic AMP phosphodiesterase CpdA